MPNGRLLYIKLKFPIENSTHQLLNAGAVSHFPKFPRKKMNKIRSLTSAFRGHYQKPFDLQGGWLRVRTVLESEPGHIWSMAL